MSAATPTALKLVLFHGSCRANRLSAALREVIVTKLKGRGHTVSVLDAKEAQFPILEKPFHHYGRFGDTEKPPQWLVEWHDKVSAADAFVILDGEYNHAPTPGMLNLIDHFYWDAYRHKPAAVCSYSYQATAGVRSAFVLRNVLSEVGLITVPAMFAAGSIPTVVKDGEFTDPTKQVLFDTVINELEWYANALNTAKSAVGPPIKPA